MGPLSTGRLPLPLSHTCTEGPPAHTRPLSLYETAEEAELEASNLPRIPHPSIADGAGSWNLVQVDQNPSPAFIGAPRKPRHVPAQGRCDGEDAE